MLIKIFKVTKKYISIIFLLSVFLTSLHHHDDLKIHYDCPIYTIQANILNIYIPPDIEYVVGLDFKYEIILEKSAPKYTYKYINSLHQRAPPYSL